MDPIERNGSAMPNGAAVAAYPGAAIGALAVGLVVILNEAGILAAPALYGPAGGVSGRTTIAVVIWLIGWGVLHRRWKNRQIDPRKIWLFTLTLIGLGILLTFPPVWRLL